MAAAAGTALAGKAETVFIKRFKHTIQWASRSAVQTGLVVFSAKENRYAKKNLPRKEGVWRDKDSNLGRRSQQIYSLPPLTARESLRTVSQCFFNCRPANSGIRTLDPEITNHVLWPAELSWQRERGAIYTIHRKMSSQP